MRPTTTAGPRAQAAAGPPGRRRPPWPPGRPLARAAVVVAVVVAQVTLAVAGAGTVRAGDDPAPEVTVSAIVVRDGDAEVVTRAAARGDVADVAAELRDLPGVVNVSLDTPVSAALAPDPHRPQQWALDALDVDGLPAGVPDGGGTVVAVLDTGVLASHEDLRGRVRCDLGADFAPDAATVDPDGRGCVDPNGHGTHVAGEIAASAGNGLGVQGVSAARLMPVRVLSAQGTGTSATVASGIVHAVDHGADVVNLSLAGPYNSAYDVAARYAEEHGVVVVAAAGNNRSSGNQANHPAASPGVIAVAASDQDGSVASFSHSGPTNDVTAPGVSILSTDVRRGYLPRTGTSMAAPLVAGVVARYLEVHPGATPAEVTAALTGTARDVGPPGRDDESGHGLVDVHRLLTGRAAQAPPGAPAVGRPVPGDAAVTVRWTGPEDDGSSPVTGYDVLVLRGDALVRTTTVGADSRAATVTDLVSGATYTVRVRARSAAGPGAVSEASSPVSPGALRRPTDVPPDGAFAGDIGWLLHRRIATGFADGSFRPVVPVSRQGMAAFFYRYAGSPGFAPPPTPTFTDVPASSPFALEVEWLAAAGITEGTVQPDGSRHFAPAAPVSRQAMAAFLYRFAGDPALPLPAAPEVADVAVGSEFRLPVEWLLASGISTGTASAGGARAYRPLDPVSRQAMAAFLRRLDGEGYPSTAP